MVILKFNFLNLGTNKILFSLWGNYLTSGNITLFEKFFYVDKLNDHQLQYKNEVQN